MTRISSHSIKKSCWVVLNWWQNNCARNWMDGMLFWWSIRRGIVARGFVCCKCDISGWSLGISITVIGNWPHFNRINGSVTWGRSRLCYCLKLWLRSHMAWASKISFSAVCKGNSFNIFGICYFIRNCLIDLALTLC